HGAKRIGGLGHWVDRSGQGLEDPRLERFGQLPRELERQFPPLTREAVHVDGEVAEVSGERLEPKPRVVRDVLLSNLQKTPVRTKQAKPGRDGFSWEAVEDGVDAFPV